MEQREQCDEIRRQPHWHERHREIPKRREQDLFDPSEHGIVVPVWEFQNKNCKRKFKMDMGGPRAVEPFEYKVFQNKIAEMDDI